MRLAICASLSLPLGLSMLACGGLSYETCRELVSLNVTNGSSSSSSKEQTSDEWHQVQNGGNSLIPVWLFISGCAVVIAPPMYLVYDKVGRRKSTLSKESKVILILSVLQGRGGWTASQTGLYLCGHLLPSVRSRVVCGRVSLGLRSTRGRNLWR